MTNDPKATATGAPETAASQTAAKAHQKEGAEEALSHFTGVRLKLQIPAY